MSVDRNTGRFPPLNLLYIASSINASGRHEARVADMVLEGEKAVTARVKKFRPDIAGVRAISFNILSALETAAVLKKLFPGMPVILGGPHPSVFPEESAGYDNIDYAVAGEGEKVILELLDRLQADESAEGLKGVAYRKGTGISFNGPAEEIENIDSLPFPDRKLLNYRKHYNILSNRYPSTTAFSGRGCIHGCSFCYHSFGRRARLRSPENVVAEMREVASLGIKDIFFVDDAFTLDRGRVMDICDLLNKSEIDLSWAVKSRVDAVDAEMLESMRRAGLTRIHFGIESASQKTLERVYKGTAIADGERALRLAREKGIKVMADFIIGAPGEKYEDALKTIELAKDLDPDFALFNVAMPYPGTRMYKEGVEDGIFNDFWKEFADSPSLSASIRYWDEMISPAELELLLKKANRSFYLRPSYIFRSLIRAGGGRMLLRKARLAFSIWKL